VEVSRWAIMVFNGHKQPVGAQLRIVLELITWTQHRRKLLASSPTPVGSVTSSNAVLTVDGSPSSRATDEHQRLWLAATHLYVAATVPTR